MRGMALSVALKWNLTPVDKGMSKWHILQPQVDWGFPVGVIASVSFTGAFRFLALGIA
jgi:hypothetical protein